MGVVQCKLVAVLLEFSLVKSLEKSYVTNLRSPTLENASNIWYVAILASHFSGKEILASRPPRVVFHREFDSNLYLIRF